MTAPAVTLGRAMANTAFALRGRRKPGETARQLLDVICGPYRDHGAVEFGDHLFPGYALGDLVHEAFGPARDFTDDDEGDGAREEHVFAPFLSHYGFC